jgi:peptidase E
MTIRRVMATSGGFFSSGESDGMLPGKTVLKMLELTGKKRPKICFILTASGDDKSYLDKSYAAMATTSSDVQHLQLFMQPNLSPRDAILNADAIWVGGGSVANMLNLWKLHGVDDLLREAYEAGTILGGVSAGSICWHLGGPTDSFGTQLRLANNGLGLLPFGNAVHFDSEEQRRPFSTELVANGTFEKIYATDDGIGILYENEVPIEVIADLPNSLGEVGPSAYLLEKISGLVEEKKLLPGRI